MKPSKLTPVLSKNWGEKDSWKIQTYIENGGYKALEKALKMQPSEVIEIVKNSGLRGRGGAGFPTGLKWSFLPPYDGKARYLVVNADESEPGTCKDIPFMMANPHLLIEGIAITCHAIQSKHAFIYLRGEVVHVYRRLLAAARQFMERKYFPDLKITVHSGAGAYICGEETALLDSLEGRRGHPRLKPPFPAVAGLYARPTIINNVESVASVPGIIEKGDQWFAQMGTEKSKGHAIYSISGHVQNPGQFEAPLGITMRELIEMAGGIRQGHQLKFWTPGGSSTPIFTQEQLDIPLDYESVTQAGSMLGTRALQVFDETTSVVRVVTKWADFYNHESCGKCTPCREGTYWIRNILHRIEEGKGQENDVDLLLEITQNLAGKSFCALGDAACSPVQSGIKTFREEFEAGCKGISARQLYPYEKTTIFGGNTND